MKILLWPNKLLKTACQPVLEGDPDYVSELEQMKELMMRCGGIGLAANQVGIMKRMLVAVDEQGESRFFINPKIIKYVGKAEGKTEGCLSLPSIKSFVFRYPTILVEHDGSLPCYYSGQLAHVLQHEIDHLDGKMMIDDMEPGSLDQIRAAMRTIQLPKSLWSKR